MTEAFPIFIGYDQREAAAYDVCRASLLRHASRPLHIVKLDDAALRQAGIYTREWRQEGNNRIDLGDLKPFSTDFAFSRFMVAPISLYQGWALFCDCDILFLSDVSALFDKTDDRYAVMVVKHDYNANEKTKMGGIEQGKYFRKNWSSVMLINCAHPSNRILTPDVVNTYPGSWLHAFSWLKDEEIGSLPLCWNWLSGVTPELGTRPSAVHFTLGIPGIHPGAETYPYANLWLEERDRIRSSPNSNGRASDDDNLRIG